MCILSNDGVTNRFSFSLCVYYTLYCILINLFTSAGLSGSAPIAIGGGSVSDLFSERERATAMALYTFGPLLGMLQMMTISCILKPNNLVLGPAIGPVAGGFITERLGIKWVFIVLAGSLTIFLPHEMLTSLNYLVIGGVASIVGIPFLKETYGPVIRLRRAMRSADPEAKHPYLIRSHESKLHVLWVNLARPMVILTRSLICFMLSLYMAL